MAKVKKNNPKAIRNRERVNFHRKWKTILREEFQTINRPNHQNQNANVTSERDEGKKEEEKVDSREQLRRWALKYNVSKRAVSELLIILISLGMNWLPKDSRSLFATPRHIEMTNLTYGKLW